VNESVGPESYDLRCKQARFEAHFRTQGISRAVVRPASAKGFRRRGASSSGNFATRRQFGGVSVLRRRSVTVVNATGRDVMRLGELFSGTRFGGTFTAGLCLSLCVTPIGSTDPQITDLDTALRNLDDH
jgi:hypothetical protein